MSRSERTNSVSNSYLGTALGRNENRIAALITGLVTAAILLVTMLPDEREQSIDFASFEPRRTYEVSLQGFILAPKHGWRFAGDRAEVIFHRRLPAAIEVYLETSRRRANAPPTTLSVGYAGIEREITFDAEHPSAQISFAAAQPARSLSFRVDPEAGIDLARMRVVPIGRVQ